MLRTTLIQTTFLDIKSHLLLSMKVTIFLGIELDVFVTSRPLYTSVKAHLVSTDSRNGLPPFGAKLLLESMLECSERMT